MSHVARVEAGEESKRGGAAPTGRSRLRLRRELKVRQWSHPGKRSQSRCGGCRCALLCRCSSWSLAISISSSTQRILWRRRTSTPAAADTPPTLRPCRNSMSCPAYAKTSPRSRFSDLFQI